MAGQYFDDETGLNYNYHRYYDPKLGRYLTVDPIGFAGGINLFTYASNMPTNLIDPMGFNALRDFQLKGVRNCIHQFDDNESKCHGLCGQDKIDCENNANENFRECLKNFKNSLDLNGDGKVDNWDNLQWFLFRRLWDLNTPPGTTYPPGYGDEGPGSSDPIFTPLPGPPDA